MIDNVEKRLEETETHISTISESTKVYLDERLEELERIPEKRYSIEEIEEKFKQKQANGNNENTHTVEVIAVRHQAENVEDME